VGFGFDDESWRGESSGLENRESFLAGRKVDPTTGEFDASRFAVGDSVWCSWLAEDVYLFSARQASLVLAAPTHA
jgi:hypothetical protein